jgi:hypothetical protein
MSIKVTWRPVGLLIIRDGRSDIGFFRAVVSLKRRIQSSGNAERALVLTRFELHVRAAIGLLSTNNDTA